MGMLPQRIIGSGSALLAVVLSGCAVAQADPIKDTLLACEVAKATVGQERDTLNFLATSFLDTRTQVEKAFAVEQSSHMRTKAQLDQIRKELEAMKEERAKEKERRR